MASLPRKMSLEEFIYDLEALEGDEETEKNCVRALEGYYWKEMPICPRCKERVEIKELHLKKPQLPALYQCNGCGKQYNVLTKTPFQSTHVPLIKWFKAYWYIKRGKEPEQFAKEINLCRSGYREARKLKMKIERLITSNHGDVLWEARCWWQEHLAAQYGKPHVIRRHRGSPRIK